MGETGIMLMRYGISSIGVQILTVKAKVVDTVIAKIFAEEGQMSDLYTLLESSNYIVLSELGPVLKRTKRYHALCLTYRQRGADNKLLDAWSRYATASSLRKCNNYGCRLIDGEWTDEDVKDPLSSMFTLLSEKRDRKLTQQWGIWLIKRDPERALKVLSPIRIVFRLLLTYAIAADITGHRKTERQARRRPGNASTNTRCEPRCWYTVFGTPGTAKTERGELRCLRLCIGLLIPAWSRIPICTCNWQYHVPTN